MRARLRLLAILLLATALLLVPGLALAGNDRPARAHRAAPAAATTYVVLPGDTLWSIARRAAPGRDPRQLVDWIQAANRLHGALRAGQVLTIPAPSR